jgi:hypothetical protein
MPVGVTIATPMSTARLFAVTFTITNILLGYMVQLVEALGYKLKY